MIATPNCDGSANCVGQLLLSRSLTLNWGSELKPNPARTAPLRFSRGRVSALSCCLLDPGLPRTLFELPYRLQKPAFEHLFNLFIGPGSVEAVYGLS